MHFALKVVNLVSTDVKVDELSFETTVAVEESLEMLRQYPNIIAQISALINSAKGE